PLIALLGLDRPTHLDAVRGKLAQEARRRVLVGAAEEHAAARVREEASIHRARDADVAETALLLEPRFAVERPRVREDAFLHPGEEHDRELEALHRVQRDERRRGRRLHPFVLAGDERDLLEEGGQLLVERQPDELLREAAQLEDVGLPLLALLGSVLQVGGVARSADHLVDELRQLALDDLGAKALEQPPERRERGPLAGGHVRDLLRPEESLRRREAPLARERAKARPRLVADAARRHV